MGNRDQKKTKNQLIEQLARLGKRNTELGSAELGRSEVATKQAEDARQEKEKMYSFMFDAVPIGIEIADLEGHILEGNQAMTEMPGYTLDELKSYNLANIYANPDDRKRLIKDLQENGRVREFEVRLKRKDGTVYYALMNTDLVEISGKKVILTTVRNITGHKRAEVLLRESEKRLSQIVQGNSIPCFVINEQHVITHWNKACENLTGLSADEICGTQKQWMAFYPQERFIMADIIVDNGTEEEVARYYGGKYRRSMVIEGAYEAEDFFPDLGDGGKWLFFTAAPLRDTQGKVIGAIETLMDITERKLAEEQIKTSLKEKELLLRELYHRTKNNMQVISGLLTLQSSFIKEEIILQIFKEIKNRIYSMSLVHQKLYQSKDLVNIDFRSYIEDLVKVLMSSRRANLARILLNLDLDRVDLPIEAAIPCGLIVNEVISNSLTHAFLRERKGEISIALHSNESDEVELRISDNGIGLPNDIDVRNPKSLGFKLIKDLIELQLDGKLVLNRDRGTEFHITFKKPQQ